MTTDYTTTHLETTALGIVNEWSLQQGIGIQTLPATREVAQQAVRIVALGPQTMDFILGGTLSTNDSGWSQWRELINYLPY